MSRNGWPRESVERALQACADDLGVSPSIQVYERWRTDAEPSYQAVVNAFGTWNDAKRAAGLTAYGSFRGDDGDD